MTQIICHHKGRYNFYSTISDAFRFESSLDIDQVRFETKEEFGSKGLERLHERLVRARKQGHSAISNESLADFLCCNRAGENEAHLSTEQCIKQFLS